MKVTGSNVIVNPDDVSIVVERRLGASGEDVSVYRSTTAPTAKELINQGGTVIHGPLVPTEPNCSDPDFATHHALFGRGGFRSVPDHGALNIIPAARRENGMLVYVEDEDNIYQLKNGEFVIWQPSTIITIDDDTVSLPVYTWVAYSNDPSQADASVYLTKPDSSTSFRWIGTVYDMPVRLATVRDIWEKRYNGGNATSSFSYSTLAASISNHSTQWDIDTPDLVDIIFPNGAGPGKQKPASKLFAWVDQVDNGRELYDYMLIVERNNTTISATGVLTSTVVLSILHQEADGTYSAVETLPNGFVLTSSVYKADGTKATQDNNFPNSNSNSVSSKVTNFGTGGGQAQIDIRLVKGNDTLGQVIIPVGLPDKNIIDDAFALSCTYVDSSVTALKSGIHSEIVNSGNEIKALVTDVSTRFSLLKQTVDGFDFTIYAKNSALDASYRDLLTKINAVAGDVSIDLTGYVKESDLDEWHERWTNVDISLNGIYTTVWDLSTNMGTRIKQEVDQIILDASGIHVDPYDDTEVRNLIASLQIKYDQIRTLIIDASNGDFSQILQTLDEINLQVARLNELVDDGYDDTDIRNYIAQLSVDLEGIRGEVESINPYTGEVDFSRIQQTINSIETRVGSLSQDLDGKYNYLESRITQNVDSIQAVASQIALSTVSDYVRNLGADTWMIYADGDPNGGGTVTYTAQANASTSFYGMRFGQSGTVWDKIGVAEQQGYTFTAQDIDKLKIPGEWAWISLDGDYEPGITGIYRYTTISQIAQWSMEKKLQVNLKYIIRKQTPSGFENVAASSLVGKVTVNYQNGNPSDVFDMTRSGYNIGLYNVGLKHSSNNKDIEFANKDDQVRDIHIDIWSAADYVAGSNGNIVSLSIQPTVASGVIVDISNGLSTVIQDESGHYDELKTATASHQSWIDSEGTHLTQIDSSISGIRTSVANLDASLSTAIRQTATDITAMVNDSSRRLSNKIVMDVSSVRTEILHELETAVSGVGQNTWIVYAAGDEVSSGTNFYYSPSVSGITRIGVRYNQVKTMDEVLGWSPYSSVSALTADAKTKLGVPGSFTWSAQKVVQKNYISSVYSIMPDAEVICWEKTGTLRVDLQYTINEQDPSTRVKTQVAAANFKGILSIKCSRVSGSTTTTKTDTYPFTSNTVYLTYTTGSKLYHNNANWTGNPYDFTKDLIVSAKVEIRDASSGVVLFSRSLTPTMQAATVQTIADGRITTAINSLDGSVASRFERVETAVGSLSTWTSQTDGSIANIKQAIVDISAGGIKTSVSNLDSSLKNLYSKGYFDITADNIRLGIISDVSAAGISITDKKIYLNANNAEFSNNVQLRGSLKSDVSVNNVRAFELNSDGSGQLGFGMISWGKTGTPVLGNTLKNAISSEAATAAQSAAITPVSYIIDCDTLIYAYNPDTNAVTGGSSGKKTITATMYKVSGASREAYSVYWFRNSGALASGKKSSISWDQSLNDDNIGGAWSTITLKACTKSDGSGVLATCVITKVAEGKKGSNGSSPSLSNVGYQYSIAFTKTPELSIKTDGTIYESIQFKIIRTAQDGTVKALGYGTSGADSARAIAILGNSTSRSSCNYDSNTIVWTHSGYNGKKKGSADASALISAAGLTIMVGLGRQSDNSIVNEPLCSAYIPLKIQTEAWLSVQDNISLGVKAYNSVSQITVDAGKIDLAVKTANDASANASKFTTWASNTGIEISKSIITLRANKVQFADSNGNNTGNIKIDPSTGTLYAKNMTAVGGSFKSITVSGDSVLTDVLIKGTLTTSSTTVSGSQTATAYNDCYILGNGATLYLPGGKENVGRVITVQVGDSATAYVTPKDCALSVGYGATGTIILSGKIATFRCVSNGYWVMQSCFIFGSAYRQGWPLSVLAFAEFNSDGSVSRRSSAWGGQQIGCSRTATGQYNVTYPAQWGTPLILVSAGSSGDSSFACNANLQSQINTGQYGLAVIHTGRGMQKYNCKFTVLIIRADLDGLSGNQFV